jgi:feruloyl esterase
MLMNTSKVLLVAVLLTLGMLHTNAQQSARTPMACADLTGLTFEGNTSITSATPVTDGTLVISPTVTATNLPPFCRVQGLSKPSSDSSIFFEVWLPQQDRWNTRFLSAGEGGFAGNPAYARNGLDGSMDELLRRGYATASTDTGHKTADTSWAVGHPEKAIDYLYRAKHLVTVAAKGVIAAHYGKPPSYSYFSSCSNGGRQGLIEAQRYPEDFDGLVIGAPWNFQSHSNAGFVWNAQALSAPGAAIPAAKLPAITAAALAACDANDGLADGIIAEPRKCRFDPSVLTCKGAETDTCLTEPQVAALKKIYAGPKNPRTGEQIFPGFAVGSEATWTNLIANLNATGLANGYFANLVFENPNWDFRTFDFDKDMSTADTKVGRLGNATSLDYSAAAKRGVKIIQYHGWNDQTLQPAYSPDYYDQLVKANGGLQATQDFFRLYMVPGMTHCSGGPGATNFGGTGQQVPPVRDALHDVQSAVEAWVERGAPPTQMIATKFIDEKPDTRTIKYTRPLCLYPTVAQYRGAGDPNDAASFVCKLQGAPGTSPTN